MSKGEYGPQDAGADRFLAALDRLDTPEIVALGAAGGGEAGGGMVGTDALDPQDVARAELRLELRDLARRAGRLDAVRAIGREVERWAGSAQHWFPAGVAGTSEVAASIGPRLAALQVVLDAAYAIVLADQLREAELALLLAPWRDLAGDPFEPGSEFASDDTLEPDAADSPGEAEDESDSTVDEPGDAEDEPG